MVPRQGQGPCVCSSGPPGATQDDRSPENPMGGLGPQKQGRWQCAWPGSEPRDGNRRALLWFWGPTRSVFLGVWGTGMGDLGQGYSGEGNSSLQEGGGQEGAGATRRPGWGTGGDALPHSQATGTVSLALDINAAETVPHPVACCTPPPGRFQHRGSLQVGGEEGMEGYREAVVDA